MRAYNLGRRQQAVDRTRHRILAAARELVAAGDVPGVGEVAVRAGVSRITVYNHFGSKAGLMRTLSEQAAESTFPAEGEPAPREQLRRLLADSCSRWAANPPLFRHLPVRPSPDSPAARALAERLAQSDQLRPGCSIKEAEDVIAALTSFDLFDRLHHDGRRSAGAVAEILLRLAGSVLAYHP